MDSLKIVCGSDTINFDGTAGYHVLWGQLDFGISQVSSDRRANTPVYDDTMVIMKIWIEDQGGTTAQVKLQTLTDVLEECARWGRRETGSDAGYISYESGTSTIGDPLRAEIVGLPSDWLDLPRSFDAVSHVTHIGDMSDPITIKFYRRGLWLDITNQSSAGPSTAVDNPGKMTITWGATTRHSSPIQLIVDNFDSVVGIDKGWLVLTRAAANVVIVEAETASGGASQADSANYASGGSVRRITASDTSYTALTMAVSGLSVGRKVAVLGVVRNNSTTNSWRVYGELQDSDNRVMGQGRVQTVDTSSQNPRLLSLGMFIIPSRQEVAQLVVRAAASIGISSPTIDFDYFVLVMMDHPENRVLVINPGGSNVNAFSLFTIKENLFVIPDVTIETDGLVIDYLDWNGDAWLSFSGTTLTGVWMGPVDTKWTNWDGVSANSQLQITGTRTAGYLTPQ